MRNGNNANSCLFGEEIAAYVYDEFDGSEREAFEDHLLNCSGCTAELADISLSRLGVFEWHRDEFVPLATPNFEIPFEVAVARASFLDSIRDFVSPFRIAFAGGTLAALFVTVGLVFISRGDADTNIVADAHDPVPPVESTTIPETKEIPSNPIRMSLPADKGYSVREYHSQALTRKLNAIQAKATAVHKNTRTIVTSARSVPRLGNFAEPEDTSLRLSDLVAGIDTKD